MEEMKVELEVDHPPHVVWQIHVKNFQASFAAAMPGVYNKVLYLEGPPLAPGGVFKACYDEGFGHYGHATFVWDEIDHDKHFFKSTLIDGGLLDKHFEKVSYYYSVLPSEDPSKSIMSWKIQYKDLNEHDCHYIIQNEIDNITKMMASYVSETREIHGFA
ncbi:hypothetical protein KP509_29G076800 [Ceratopteris richardii]|uniref:Bet v I/Major latex protein domain-containing protein n=1 Tax=Ceratopteris richardii TaxID=49495 RepID=A0A8T2RA94_CERRI|nr:hypothetical protein KP509_29G076800 [Ceratopteris richardii]